MTSKEKRRTILCCLMGNILEWFDFAVYGYLAPLIANLFFPVFDKFSSMLLAYSVFALGFIVRPFGAICFGFIGDIYGRKKALIISSLTMAIPTILIGCLPTYQSIGIAAPLLLMICRMFQGFSVGGEFTGSLVYLVEQGPENKKGFFSCWADIGCGLGMILGSICIAALYSFFSVEQFINFGWRLSFLSGILLAGLSMYIRLYLSESPEFILATHIQIEEDISLNGKTVKQSSRSTITPKSNLSLLMTPLKELLVKHPANLSYAILLVSINVLSYYILLVFISNQTILLGKLSASDAYLLNSLILLIIMLSTFMAAYACDYVDKTKLYTIGTIAIALFAYPTFYALYYLSLDLQILTMLLFAFSIGFCFGPRSLFLVQSFPTHLRFSAIALVLSIGNALFGGTAPFLSSYIQLQTAIPSAPALLVMAAALLTLFAIHKLKIRVSNPIQVMQQKVVLDRNEAENETGTEAVLDK